MSSESLVKLALSSAGLSQKALGEKVGVSAAQVSKWKKGEYISYEMEEKLTELAGIGDRDPDVVFWTGGIESADKWGKLVLHLAEVANECSDTSYVSDPLLEETELISSSLFHTLKDAGWDIPTEFPKELNISYEDMDEEQSDTIEGHEVYRLMYKVLKALAELYDFYTAYISELIDDELFDSPACNIEPCLIELALAKVGDDNPLLPNFKEFRYTTLNNYSSWIEIVKNHSVLKGVPLRAEITKLISEDPYYLTYESEAEAFGFNKNRLHPDIYMNELLVGMRLIHQVLPAICKKLDITEEELTIDDSSLKT